VAQRLRMTMALTHRNPQYYERLVSRRNLSEEAGPKVTVARDRALRAASQSTTTPRDVVRPGPVVDASRVGSR